MAKMSKVKQHKQKKGKFSKQTKHKKGNKSKDKKSKKLQKNVKVPLPPPKVHTDSEESDHGEDMLAMVEKDDLSFIKKSVINHSYSILKKIRVNEPSNNVKSNKRKRSNVGIDEGLEQDYEEQNVANDGKKTKVMLPIKTKQGLVQRSIEVEDNEIEDSYTNQPQPEENKEDQTEDSDDDDDIDWENSMVVDDDKPVTTAALMAAREKALHVLQLRLGVLCSGLLEDPESKIANLTKLLKMLEDDRPEIWISTRKLTLLSLLEVFKDILPMYQIKHQDTGDTKLKKGTLRLIKFEDALLIGYKKYLQKLDKFSAVLTKKGGNKKNISEAEKKLGEISVQCFCELLLSHPYFNFSKNIVQFLVPFLNNSRPHVRKMVKDTCVTLFKDDKKGEITLEVVRKINILVKLKLNCVHTDVLEPLLALKMREVSLEKVKEDTIKQKKLNARKQRLRSLSKKEKKKKKQLQELEKELLEAKAEESKQLKQKCLTEILNAAFTIYFRILKHSPNSKILEVTLEGLAKFAHCINLEYYSELVDVINRLLETESLTHRQQLHCIQTVFTILSGLGEVLNIDPLRFYSHLYRNLLAVNAGKNHDDLIIVLKILEIVLIKRRKKVTQQRMLAFTKRLGTLALHTLQNGTMGCLTIIKTIMQQSKMVDILLDFDLSVGDGQYLPESEEPEYANAGNTALWELILLKHHFHPTVRKMATHITIGVPATGEGSLPPEIGKLSAELVFNEYSPSEMGFKPAIKPPRAVVPKDQKFKTNFIDQSFKTYCKKITARPLTENVDFSVLSLKK